MAVLRRRGKGGAPKKRTLPSPDAERREEVRPGMPFPPLSKSDGIAIPSANRRLPHLRGVRRRYPSATQRQPRHLRRRLVIQQVENLFQRRGDPPSRIVVERVAWL